MICFFHWNTYTESTQQPKKVMHISYKNIFIGILLVVLWYCFWLFSYNYHIWFSQWNQIFSPVSTNTWYTSVLTSKKVQEVNGYIEKYYYGFQQKSQQKVEDDFLHALALSEWDRFTNYFSTTEAKKFEDTLQWDFDGIGAVIQENSQGVQVSKVIAWSPAEKNWLKWGDIITQVDGQSIAWLTPDQAVDKIHWPKWTIVHLKVIQLDTGKTKDFDIQRDTIVVPTIQTEKYKSIGYISMSIFGEETTKDFIKAFNTLVDGGSKWVIIDLRDNGGGYLDTAVDILSLFLPENTVAVITRWNSQTDNVTYMTRPNTKSNITIPIIVLVNSMSASASEITAWALQDNKRALILGEKTFGKGSVQTPFPLSDGSMIKITTAKWFTPNNRSIDEKWIDPDVSVDFTLDDYKNKYDRQLEDAKKLLQIQIDQKLSVDQIKTQAKDILSH